MVGRCRGRGLLLLTALLMGVVTVVAMMTMVVAMVMLVVMDHCACGIFFAAADKAR